MARLRTENAPPRLERNIASERGVAQTPDELRPDSPMAYRSPVSVSGEVPEVSASGVLQHAAPA